MNDALRECPFCGSAGMIIADDVLGPNELRYTPMCTSWILWRETRFTSHFSGPPECGAYVWGVFNTEAEAIAAWNRRVPAPPRGVPVEVREALEWLLDNSQPLAVLEVTWTRQRGIVYSWLDAQGQEATNG